MQALLWCTSHGTRGPSENRVLGRSDPQSGKAAGQITLRSVYWVVHGRAQQPTYSQQCLTGPCEGCSS